MPALFCAALIVYTSVLYGMTPRALPWKKRYASGSSLRGCSASHSRSGPWLETRVSTLGPVLPVVITFANPSCSSTPPTLIERISPGRYAPSSIMNIRATSRRTWRPESFTAWTSPSSSSSVSRSIAWTLRWRWVNLFGTIQSTMGSYLPPAALLGSSSCMAKWYSLLRPVSMSFFTMLE